MQGCDLDALVQGERERHLEVEGFLGSFFLGVRALDTVGLAQEPGALEPGRLLGEEVAEAPPDLRLLRRTEGEAARGTTLESPCSADKLSDAGEQSSYRLSMGR